MGRMRLGGKPAPFKSGLTAADPVPVRRYSSIRNFVAQRGGRGGYARISSTDERSKSGGGPGADTKQTPTTHHYGGNGKPDGGGGHNYHSNHPTNYHHSDHQQNHSQQHSSEMQPSTPRHSGPNGGHNNNSSSSGGGGGGGGGSAHGIPLLSTPISFGRIGIDGGANSAEMPTTGQYVTVPVAAAPLQPQLPPPPPLPLASMGTPYAQFVPCYPMDDPQVRWF